MRKILRIVGLSILVFLTGCGDRQQPPKLPSAHLEDIYTCSMHPQVIEHHPGNCPICGMELIKKNTAPVATNDIELERILRPTNQSIVSSLATISPGWKNRATPVTAYGTIEYDTRAATTISARIAGRIEKMYIRYRYQEIRKGQKIMDIYSPEIVSAEQNLLFLLQNDADNAPFIQAAKERLSLLGMSEGQLQQVIRTGKPLYAVSIYSNYDGHVHEAGMMQEGQQPANDQVNSTPLTQELSLKEGMYVQKGQTLLMIMDHHRVWAALQIFSSDQSLVKVGDAVRIVPETDTMAVINANIDLIEPFFRPTGNTITARVYFHNEDMLPVGSHVSATIYTAKHNRLWLPQSSVLSLGLEKLVFRKVPGGFTAHKIVTGIRSGSEIEVITGLNEKDSVAANAQYFTDSESFIRSSN
jgi:Cu(I)/Ag(I) efflux system membrane fusion protein